jgi:hypothetical protein
VTSIVVFPALAIAEARASLRTGTNELEVIAQAIVDTARSAAPVETGEWKNSMQVTTSGGRVYAESTDEESIYKEYGTSDTPAHAVMTNSARRFGKYTGMQPR